jgi:hypothetical protein
MIGKATVVKISPAISSIPFHSYIRGGGFKVMKYRTLKRRVFGIRIVPVLVASAPVSSPCCHASAYINSM